MSELAKRPEYEVSVTSAKDAFIKVAGEDRWNIEVIFALQAIRANDVLQRCTHESIRNAVINVALTGITLNPVLQFAFLVPRKGKAVLDISYRGLCKIAVDSGSVYDIDAVPVFQEDEFYYEMGSNPVLKHVPKMFEDEKEKKIKAVYAIAILHHGIKKFVVLDKEKIERARKSSQTGNVWSAHYDEMAKKTAVKLLYKLLPQHTERMSTAISVINEHEGLSLRDGKKAEELEKRFGFKREENKKGAVEAEIILKCPIDDTIAAVTACEKCKEKGSCSVYAEIQKRVST